jgi:hypothetical protein
VDIERVPHLVVVIARAEVEIVLQRHADQVGHRVLGFLGKLFRAVPLRRAFLLDYGRRRQPTVNPQTMQRPNSFRKSFAIIDFL